VHHGSTATNIALCISRWLLHGAMIDVRINCDQLLLLSSSTIPSFFHDARSTFASSESSFVNIKVRTTFKKKIEAKDVKKNQ